MRRLKKKEKKPATVIVGHFSLEKRRLKTILDNKPTGNGPSPRPVQRLKSKIFHIIKGNYNELFTYHAVPKNARRVSLEI